MVGCGHRSLTVRWNLRPARLRSEEDADQRCRGDRHGPPHARPGAAGELGLSWPELIAFKRTFTDPVPANHERRYAEHGIAAFHGKARFTWRDTVEVNEHSLRAGHVLIATGARPMPLTFRGAEHVITSDRFLKLERLPERIVMVGGGYVAAEFSHIAARAGAKVTVMQRAERMLTRFELELVGWLMEKFAEIGVEVRTGTAVEAIEEMEGGFRVYGRAGSKETAIDTDLVVHAAGRVPDLDLNPLAAGITVENGRLALNEFLQSVSNPAVYAAGDAAAKGRLSSAVLVIRSVDALHSASPPLV
jgi:glutathione reductase (NADPH)